VRARGWKKITSFVLFILRTYKYMSFAFLVRRQGDSMIAHLTAIHSSSKFESNILHPAYFTLTFQFQVPQGAGLRGAAETQKYSGTECNGKNTGLASL
jgi:hypothetical protein